MAAPRRVAPFGHQKSRDGARITEEASARMRKLNARLVAAEDELERVRLWRLFLRDELMPWLTGFAVAMGYPPPPEPPEPPSA